MSRLISFVLLIILFGASTVSGQEYKDSIQVQFLRYTECLINKDFSASAEYLNPNFFKIIPKSKLVEVMENAFNNPVVELSLKAPKVVSIDNSKSIKGEHYAKLKYSNNMVIRYKESNEDRDVEEEMETLQSTFGEKNVTYDAAANSYTIFVTKEVIANSKDQRRWTFVVLEERQKPLLEKFIPKEML